MQITSQMMSNQQATNSDLPLTLREGEVYRATIKERLGNNEAILQIRGKEVQAKFADSIPSGERVAVQVDGQKGQVVEVRAIVEDSRGTTTTTQGDDKAVERILQRLGA
ncbi:MAG TPA: hypothetical protein GX525_03630, partial [Bacilli bacterium]|nr:hypothetical protein [Bacilli bacterium]